MAVSRSRMSRGASRRSRTRRSGGTRGLMRSPARQVLGTHTHTCNALRLHRQVAVDEVVTNEEHTWSGKSALRARLNNCRTKRIHLGGNHMDVERLS